MADALAAAGLEPVVELRFPPLWTARPQPSWSPAAPGESTLPGMTPPVHRSVGGHRDFRRCGPGRS